MVGIVQNIAQDRKCLENDEEDDNTNDCLATKLMDITISVFNVVGTWIKNKEHCQGNIFRDDYQKVDKLSQECWLVLVSNVEEVIVIIGIEACHGVEQETYYVSQGQ